jgi:hypothetical protein
MRLLEALAAATLAVVTVGCPVAWDDGIPSVDARRDASPADAGEESGDDAGGGGGSPIPLPCRGPLRAGSTLCQTAADCAAGQICVMGAGVLCAQMAGSCAPFVCDGGLDTQSCWEGPCSPFAGSGSNPDAGILYCLVIGG